MQLLRYTRLVLNTVLFLAGAEMVSDLLRLAVR